MGSHSNRGGRQRILEVAEELFTTRGYQAVSIRDIAQACEFTNAALYYHFANKEALFYEVMEWHTSNLRERMQQAGKEEVLPKERVVSILAEYSRISADRRSPLFLLRRGMWSLNQTKDREHHSQLIHAMLQPLEEVLNEAVQHGELRSLPQGYSLAALLVGMLHGLVQHRHTCQGITVALEDVRLVVDIFWNGLKNRQEK